MQSTDRILVARSVRFQFRRRSLASLMVGAFVVIHAAYYASGVRFDEAPLTAFWQNLDVELLRSRLAQSLFYLHCQPPLWNLALGLVLKVAPHRHLLAFWGMALAAGLLLYGALFCLLRRLGAGPRLSFILATLFVASPAFVLQEHCLFYAFPLAGLLTASALCLDLLLRKGGVLPAIGFFGSLLCLEFTWALFHLVHLCLVTAGLWWLAPRTRRLLLRVGVPALALLGVLYAKNLVLFGEFAPSTWVGMNMARVTIRRLEHDERDRLVRRGVLSDVAGVRPFAPLADYPARLREESRFEGVACLHDVLKSTGSPNMNHIAYVRISSLYLHDAVWVACHEPSAYLKGIREAWLDYLSSATESSFLDANRDAARIWVSLEDRAYGRLPRPSFERQGVSYHLYPALDLALLAGFAGGLAAAFGRRGAADPSLRVLALYLCFNIAWVALVGNSLEVGENNRFRFATDPLSVALLGGVLSRRAALRS
jgi:hypothetical protein